MPRPLFQFRLSTLLLITLAVACFFGGMATELIRKELQGPEFGGLSVSVQFEKPPK